MIDNEFNKFATKNGVTCNYRSFAFIAKEDNKIVGIITGNSYYKEVHISDLIILEEYRNKQIGSKLVETAGGAIAQIKNKEYCRSLEEYEGNILLVGVNYNKQTKEHECVIEEYVK